MRLSAFCLPAPCRMLLKVSKKHRDNPMFFILAEGEVKVETRYPVGDIVCFKCSLDTA